MEWIEGPYVLKTVNDLFNTLSDWRFFSAYFLFPIKVTQAEVDPLINKPISTTQEIHPQFNLFICAPRIIIPDATIPVSLTCYAVLFIIFTF